MTEEALKKLTTESLKNQKKGQKILLGALLGLTVALLFFPLYGMMNGKELDTFEFIMPICTIGGAFLVWDEMRKINKELVSRNV